MFYKRKVKGKNILCLESHWGGASSEPRTSIKPMLDFITISRGTSYTYNLVHTIEEFNYVLNNTNVRNFTMLFLAFHGKSEKIMLGTNSEFDITLDDLSKVMGARFAGYGIHFSSCSVLNSSKENIAKFMDDTQVSFVTGYGQGVDYIESAVMDLAYIGRWFHYKSVNSMFKSIKKSYKDFIRENNFLYYVR